MMDEQRLKDAENSIGLIDCPDCEQGRVSREGTFEDGQEYERCETCDGSGMVSRFPDGHALIAEVRRLQQENAVLCNGGELQRCVVNAAYEDKCKAEQQRDTARAEVAQARAALQAALLNESEVTIATLRAALARVEWVDGQCPWCRAWRSNAGHWPDCARQAALGLKDGER